MTSPGLLKLHASLTVCITVLVRVMFSCLVLQFHSATVQASECSLTIIQFPNTVADQMISNPGIVSKLIASILITGRV